MDNNTIISMYQTISCGPLFNFLFHILLIQISWSQANILWYVCLYIGNCSYVLTFFLHSQMFLYNYTNVYDCFQNLAC